MISPPSAAPRMETSPPRIVAGNTLSPKWYRELLIPLMFPMRTPPMPETTAEMIQESAKMHLTEIPIDCATCWLKAVARMATPALENLKKAEKTASRNIERTKHQRNSWEMGTPAIVTMSWGNSFGSYTRMSFPQIAVTSDRMTR